MKCSTLNVWRLKVSRVSVRDPPALAADNAALLGPLCVMMAGACSSFTVIHSGGSGLIASFCSECGAIRTIHWSGRAACTHCVPLLWLYLYSQRIKWAFIDPPGGQAGNHSKPLMKARWRVARVSRLIFYGDAGRRPLHGHAQNSSLKTNWQVGTCVAGSALSSVLLAAPCGLFHLQRSWSERPLDHWRRTPTFHLWVSETLPGGAIHLRGRDECDTRTDDSCTNHEGKGTECIEHTWSAACCEIVPLGRSGEMTSSTLLPPDCGSDVVWKVRIVWKYYPHIRLYCFTRGYSSSIQTDNVWVLLE